MGSNVEENTHNHVNPINCEINGNSYLFAFDFDRTIINDDSDDQVIAKFASTALHDDFEKFLDGPNWLDYLNKVWKHVHDHGVGIDEMCNFIKGMEPTSGILPLLSFLVQLKATFEAKDKSGDGKQSLQPKIRLLLISGANDLFIRNYITARFLEPMISKLNGFSKSFCDQNGHQFPFDIIANKAVILGNQERERRAGNVKDLLQILPFEVQTSCQLCPRNLCKGAAISNYIHSNGPFAKIFYTGDGSNDVCPVMKLNVCDLVFVRKNYALHKLIAKSKDKLGINAKLVFWENGELITNTIKHEFSMSTCIL